jgi:hypothetical protein
MHPEPSTFERIQLLRAPPPLPLDDPYHPAHEIAAEEEVAAEEDAPKRGGFLRTAVFLIVMAAFGSGLAVFWHDAGAELWASGRLWPAFASQSPPAGGSTTPEQPLERMAGELAALKAGIGELSAAQQQMAATIAALQTAQQQLRAAQQDLGQRPGGMSSGPAWFSNAMTFNSAAVAGQQLGGAPPTPQQSRAAAPPRPSAPAPAPNGRAPNAAAPRP